MADDLPVQFGQVKAEGRTPGWQGRTPAGLAHLLCPGE